MAATGYSAPGTTTNDTSIGFDAWSDVNNTQASDDAYATVGLGVSSSFSNYIKATNFGFNISSGETITGVTVEIERKGALSITDYSIRLVKGGAISGDDKATATSWNTSDSADTYGGESDLWGLSLTADDINSSDFGVAVAAKQAGGFNTAYIDSIRINVYYGASVSSGGYGFKVSKPGYDVNTADDSQLAMTSSLISEAVYAQGFASFTISGNTTTMSIAHGLGYAPQFLILDYDGYGFIMPFGLGTTGTSGAETWTCWATSTDVKIKMTSFDAYPSTLITVIYMILYNPVE